jgi:putative DNA primase/helicase
MSKKPKNSFCDSSYPPLKSFDDKLFKTVDRTAEREAKVASRMEMPYPFSSDVPAFETFSSADFHVVDRSSERKAALDKQHDRLYSRLSTAQKNSKAGSRDSLHTPPHTNPAASSSPTVASASAVPPASSDELLLQEFLPALSGKAPTASLPAPVVAKRSTPKLTHPVSVTPEKPKVIPMATMANKFKYHNELVRVGECVYHYNGRYYSPLDINSTVLCYRGTVDPDFGLANDMKGIKQLYDCLATDPSIRLYDPELENPSPICPLENGVFDINTQRLMNHNPAFMTFSYVKACYDPEAECPCFDQFLEQVTAGNKALQKRLWYFLGYILMQPTMGKYFFLMGFAPDSGKSTLGNFIVKLFPKECVSKLSPDELGGRFEASSLLSADLNVSLDLSSETLSNKAVSCIKRITGGDGMTIQRKYLSSVEFNRKVKFVFASNHVLHINNDDPAFWRRLVYLPFEYTVPDDEKDNQLNQRIWDERNGIVTRALFYAKKLAEANYVFPSTPVIDSYQAQLQGISESSIESFLQDCCELDENAKTAVSTLFNHYEAYCQMNGLVSVNCSVFKRFLEEALHLEHTRARFRNSQFTSNPVSAFQGIRLIDDPV